MSHLISHASVSASPTLSNHSLQIPDEFGTKPRMKVLSVAHSACREGSSRLRYEALAAKNLIDLTLIVPARWKEYGSEYAAQITPGTLDVRAYRSSLTHFPGANWHMHFYSALPSLVDQLSPDVLHVWQEPWSVLALQAALLCARRKRPMALILETDQNILRRLPFPFEQIRRYTLRRTNTLIYRHPEALEVSRACGFQGPAARVEYCVDSRAFHLKDRLAMRQEFGNTNFTVGYVGRLIAEKGLFSLLDSVHQCGAPINVSLLGEGPALQPLRQKASSLGIQDRIRFLSPRPPQEVASFMNSVDVLALLSLTTKTWKEQFGRVIMEAQACGTPVIGSTSGSIPDVVGKGGWIVPENDSAALSRLLARLASHPEEVRQKASEAVYGMPRFSAETVSSQLLTVYKMAWKDCNQSKPELGLAAKSNS